jgi:hypothetical protein
MRRTREEILKERRELKADTGKPQSSPIRASRITPSLIQSMTGDGSSLVGFCH